MASISEDKTILETIKSIIVKRIMNRIYCIQGDSTKEVEVYTVFPFIFYDSKYDVGPKTGRFYKCTDDNGNWKLFDNVKSGIIWLDGDINVLASGDLSFSKENYEEDPKEENKIYKQTYKTKVLALGKFEVEIDCNQNTSVVSLYFKENGRIRADMTYLFSEETSIKELVKDVDNFIKEAIDYMHNSTGEVAVERTYTYEWDLKTDNNRTVVDTIYVNKDLVI